MNVCPFAPEIDPPDRFLPAAPALIPQFGKVAMNPPQAALGYAPITKIVKNAR